MIEPYYDDGRGIVIYHGDCREVLPQLKPSSVDLLLTDPPFFMPAVHYQSRVHWQRAWSDTTILGAFWSTILDGVVPLLRPTGHAITFCNGESYPVFYPEMYRRFDTLSCLVWDKGHVGLGRIWRHQHELIIAARWEDSVFFDDGQLRADILRCQASPSDQRQHPVEKPIALLQQLIMPTTQHDSIILDPFAGSGTTLMAAKLLGRKAIGIEGEERYVEIAVKRLAQEVMPLGV